MKTKLKTCRVCKGKFIPFNSLQTVCTENNFACAIKQANTKRIKLTNKVNRIQKEAYKIEKERIKTRSDWIKEVQVLCNQFIRLRDNGKPCISCNRPTKAGDHAGHWKPTSSSPELRFSEENIHLQCVQCNLHLHGNVAHYRAGLIQRIGLDRVEWLEGKHPPAKWTIIELKALKTEFKLKLKAINDNR